MSTAMIHMHTCTICTIFLKEIACFTLAHKATRYIVTQLTAIILPSFMITFINVYTRNNGYMEKVQLISSNDKIIGEKLLLHKCIYSPEHVELSKSKEYPALHPHSKEPTVLEQVWEQLFPPE